MVNRGSDGAQVSRESARHNHDIEQIKRATHLFFSLEDGLFLDIEQLLHGSVVLTKDTLLRAISILTEQDYDITTEVVQILSELPSNEWVSISAVAEKHGVDSDLIDDLAYKGLVISDQTDTRLTELRQRDEALRSTRWERHALLYHYLSKWQDVQIHIPDEEDSEELWESLPEREKKYEQFVDVYGKPPPHFHTIPNASQKRELPVITIDDGVFRTLARRKTTRIFDTQNPVSVEELSIVLYYVWGCHGYWPVYKDIVGLKKTSPSGGDLHPTEVYPLITNVSGLDPGMYHYNVENHRLDLMVSLTQEEAIEWANAFTAGQTFFSQACALFIMTTRFYRNFWKYRKHPRAYSVLLMDTAHLSQSFYLACTELGLGAFVTAAINAGNIEKRLGLDPVREGAIAICGCGKPPEDKEDKLGLQPEFLPYIPRETTIEGGE